MDIIKKFKNHFEIKFANYEQNKKILFTLSGRPYLPVSVVTLGTWNIKLSLSFQTEKSLTPFVNYAITGLPAGYKVVIKDIKGENIELNKR